MPAILLHLAYTRAHLRKHPELNEIEVYRASVFPDIRRMADLPREQTHSAGVNLDEIEREPDSWRVGWLLHSYLDETWNRYVNEFDVAAVHRHDEELWRAIKLAEEAEFYETMSNREEIAKMFDTPPMPVELESVVDPALIERWNRFVVHKLRYPFSAAFWSQQAVAVGYSREYMLRLLDMVEKIRTDEVWLERLWEIHGKLGV